MEILYICKLTSIYHQSCISTEQKISDILARQYLNFDLT